MNLTEQQVHYLSASDLKLIRFWLAAGGSWGPVFATIKLLERVLTPKGEQAFRLNVGRPLSTGLVGCRARKWHKPEKGSRRLFHEVLFEARTQQAKIASPSPSVLLILQCRLKRFAEHPEENCPIICGARPVRATEKADSDLSTRDTFVRTVNFRREIIYAKSFQPRAESWNCWII